jgi:CheY-like chemotaxis protein
MSKTLLVLDDDPENLEIMTAVLRSKGYEVIGCGNGAEGFRLLLKHRPDLAVVDLKMPGMSGLEFCRRLRRTPEVAQTPVLVVSGLLDDRDKPDAYWAAGLGADDYLAKPFDPLALLSRAEYLLRKGRYVSDAVEAPVATDRSPSSPPSDPAPRASQSLSPQEVVRVFVESWNSGDFGAEYDAMGEEMLGGLTRTEYIQRREQSRADDRGRTASQRVLDATQSVSHHVAKVICLREDIVGGIPRAKEETYVLKQTQAGWKIVSVRSKPLPFAIE